MYIINDFQTVRDSNRKLIQGNNNQVLKPMMIIVFKPTQVMCSFKFLNGKENFLWNRRRKE